jgi:hypothetical protein
MRDKHSKTFVYKGGNIQTLYVKATGKDEALELMEKLKELAKKM